MPSPPPTPDQIAKSLADADRLRDEIARKERAIRRRTQGVAKALAALMGPAGHSHRVGIGIHTFEVEGSLCLCAAYLEDVGKESRYRYAVLSGGEAAVRALRTARLHPGDSDEPGPRRRVALASYVECEEFLDRLPKFIADATRDLERRLDKSNRAEALLRDGQRALRAATKRSATSRERAD
jgi:hypothetical protein